MSLLCNAPWHGLFVRTNGSIAPCCAYQGHFGNLSETDLDSLLNNDSIRNLQSSILNKNFPTECTECKNKELVNNHSRRKFFEIFTTSDSTTDYSKPVKDIQYLDISLSTVCNLKCRHCHGGSSTAWLKDEAKISSNPKFRRMPASLLSYSHNSADIINKMFAYPEYFKNLKFLNLKGGEPFMEPANKELMNFFIERDLAKNIVLDIGTNGTIIDKEFNQLAQQFKSVKITVSVEGVGKLYNYIRGGDNFTFEQLEENVEVFEIFDQVIITGTVMTYNACHLNELRKWFDKIQKPKYQLYTNNVVTNPKYLNPTILPDEILKDTEFKHNPTLSNELEVFIEYTRTLDAIRGTNVLDVCPEFEQLFS